MAALFESKHICPSGMSSMILLPSRINLICSRIVGLCSLNDCLIWILSIIVWFLGKKYPSNAIKRGKTPHRIHVFWVKNYLLKAFVRCKSSSVTSPTMGQAVLSFHAECGHIQHHCLNQKPCYRLHSICDSDFCYPLSQFHLLPCTRLPTFPESTASKLVRCMWWERESNPPVISF